MKTENITRDRQKRGIHGRNLKTEWKVEKCFFEKKFTRVQYTHNFMYVPRNENNNQQQQQKNE